jgi:hypothetical protein
MIKILKLDSIALIFLLSGLSLRTFSQEIKTDSLKINYLDHIHSIQNQKTKRPKKKVESNGDTTFLDYSIRKIIELNNQKYITNRNLLNEIENVKCSPGFIKMEGEIEGEKITIEIALIDFDSVSNIVIWGDDNTISSINGLFPYGNCYSNPEIQIDEIKIRIKDKQIEIPKSAYENLYEPNLCESFDYTKKIEAFVSNDQANIYIYIYGGTASDTYFTKLIFDKNKFITRWISDYYPLSRFGCFGEDFIGF